MLILIDLFIFAANGSVLRNCAPIAFEECKEANGVNYCYCKREGCNTPDRRLSPSVNDTSSFSSLGDAQAAARVSSSDKSFTRYFDDEDFVEGSGDWGDFYYDDYNYIERSYHYPAGDIDDTEDGDGAYDGSDVTDPPPYLDLEHPVDHHEPRHKYDRNNGRDRTDLVTHTTTHETDSDISIDDDDDDDATDSYSIHSTKPKHSSSTTMIHFSCHPMLIMLLIFQSEVLVGI